MKRVADLVAGMRIKQAEKIGQNYKNKQLTRKRRKYDHNGLAVKLWVHNFLFCTVSTISRDLKSLLRLLGSSATAILSIPEVAICQPNNEADDQAHQVQVPIGAQHRVQQV